MEKIDKTRVCGYIPEEFIIQILFKLPVKSLLRFKTVRKSWYNIITSSYFIKNHYLVFNNNDRNTHFLVYDALPTSDIERDFPALSYESLSRDHHYLDYLRIPTKSIQYILGPVNGLMLLCPVKHIHLGLALLNPATRELSTIFVPDSDKYQESYNQKYGFGFDPLTNDFKVVSLWLPVSPDIPTRIDVYSLANDSWKQMDPFPMISNRQLASYTSIYLNGVSYWLMMEQINGNDFHYPILSFDNGKEVFQQIKGPQCTMPIPDVASLFLYNDDSLGMFLGQSENLILGYNMSFFYSIDLLKMKEVGCWTKYLTLDVSLLQVRARKALGVWKNDNHFLETWPIFNSEGDLTPKLVLYDPSSHAIKDLEIPNMGYYCSLKVLSYKESLVSVVKEGENSKRRSWSDFVQHLLWSSIQGFPQFSGGT